jgi:tetratricopeptide (TPR) repeat protein
LLSEAIRLVNQTQQEISNEDRAPTQSDVKKVERGVEMVKRAKALGNPQAAEQLQTAEEILRTLKTVVVAGKAHKLREKAFAAAEKEDWSTAVAALEEALASLPENAPADFRRQLEKDLKTCRENREGSRIGQNLQEIMNLREQAANCAQAEDWSGAISRLERALSMIPSGAPADFRKVVSKELATCLTNAAVVGLNAALASGSPYQMQTALSEAHSQLKRADSLDPNNSHIRTQLRQVEDIMKRVGVGGYTPSYSPRRSHSGPSNSTAGYDVVVFLLGAASVLLNALNVQGCPTYGTALTAGAIGFVAFRAQRAGFFTKLGFGLALLGLVLAIS